MSLQPLMSMCTISMACNSKALAIITSLCLAYRISKKLLVLVAPAMIKMYRGGFRDL